VQRAPRPSNRERGILMGLMTNTAAKRTPLAMVAVVAAAATGLLPGLAHAQQQQPAPQQPQQPQQQQGPTIVQVKPEPSQTDWTKVCGQDQAANKEVCYTTRDFVSDQGQPVLAVAVY